MINAMLDEERLVPTNCMRACTAVVTEISYNYEEEPYRAQIEFISVAEWEKELRALVQDLFDSNGQVSRGVAMKTLTPALHMRKSKRFTHAKPRRISLIRMSPPSYEKFPVSLEVAGTSRRQILSNFTKSCSISLTVKRSLPATRTKTRRRSAERWNSGR